MRMLKELSRGVWVGLLLIGLSIVVWFIAPQAQSCVSDFDATACETIGVVILNVIGLVLFVVGGLVITVASAIARNEKKRRRGTERQNTT